MISMIQQILPYQNMKTQVSFVLQLKIYLKSLYQQIRTVAIISLGAPMGNISLSKKKLIGSDINDSEKETIAIEEIFMRHYKSVYQVMVLYQMLKSMIYMTQMNHIMTKIAKYMLDPWIHLRIAQAYEQTIA